MKRELLEEILTEAKVAFQSLKKEEKILVWDEDDIHGLIYKVETEEDYLNRIKNRFERMTEDLNETDEDELEELDFNKVFDEEFDFEYTGWKEYYNPVEKIKDKNYKYTYLICFVDHANRHRDYLETIVYSNVEINSTSEMLQILELKKEKTPAELSKYWRNCYFEELNEFDEDSYILYDDEDNWELIYV